MLSEISKNLFYSHLLYEYKHGVNNNDILFETRSRVPYINEIVESIINSLKENIRTLIKNKEDNVLEYDEKTINLNKNSFFERIILTVNFHYTRKTSYSGGIKPLSSFVTTNNEIVFRPVININLNGSNFYDTIDTLSFAIGHELTHGYDYYQYFLKHGFPQDKTNIEKSGLSRYNKGMQSTNSLERAISSINYRLSLRELNAYIGQLAIEIKKYANEISNSKEALNVLYKTESFKTTYNYLENEINAIIYGNLNDNTKKDIIELTNKICNKNFTSYNQVIKYYFNRWYKWSEKYMTKASKIIYDIFEEYAEPIIYDNFGKKETLK